MFRSQSSRLLLLPALSFALAACGGSSRGGATTVVVTDPPAPVEIEVEVYDPITNFVWEGVGVRIVEAYVEPNRGYLFSPLVDDFFFTDPFGLVYFAPEDLAFANVGFTQDALGRAVLEPFLDADEAWVVLEVWSPGFLPVEVEVYLSWDQPFTFVSIPFEDTFIPTEGANVERRAKLMPAWEASRDS